MRKLLYTFLILCLVCPQIVRAQRRYQVAEQWEYQLQRLNDFSTNDVNNKTDVMWGLHTSQYTGTHHLIGLSLEGSWSAFVSNMPAAKITPGGGAAGAHLLYEFQYSGLLIQTGLGVNFQQVYTNIADSNMYHLNMHDTWSDVQDVEFTLKHDLHQRRDMSRNLYVQLPIYAGHYILSPVGIGYWLAGVHINYAFMGKTAQSTLVTTSGLYERYVGIWEEMDNHGFRKDVPLERSGKQLKLKMDVMAHAEMGYEWTTYNGPHSYRVTKRSETDIRMRVGAFVDFGILNICPRTDNVLYDIPEETIYDFSTYQMEHIFSTQDARSFWMRNLYVGLRFTFLFGFPPQEHCILCDSYRH